MRIKDLEQEKRRLAYVYQELDSQLEQAQGDLRKYRQEMLAVRSSLWEGGIGSAGGKGLIDAAQQITELERGGGYFGLARESVKRLQASLRAPYFGRIDFKEEGISKIEPLYIGIRSLIERKTGQPLIYDWRAPVSSMFYDFGLGNAQYEGPGGVYEGEISLKRQYRIKDRVLDYMFENDLKIDDQLLQEVLGRSVSKKMRNIVNTIQRRQNLVIRNEKDSLLLVEGPAGSGKTSVALHRLAYLLYRYRQQLDSENIVVFSPNQVFSDYISWVLPELGEENVTASTFQDCAERFFDWKWEVQSQYSYLEELWQQDLQLRGERLRSVSFKSSEEFKKILERLLLLIIENAVSFADLETKEGVIFSKEEQQQLFKEYYDYLPVQARLNQIHRRFLFLLRPVKRKRFQSIFRTVERLPAFQDQSYWAKARRAAKLLQIEFEPILSQAKQCFKVDSFAWYERLWQDAQLWSEISRGQPFFQEGKESLHTLKKGLISYEDAAPLLFLAGELEGYPADPKILHVVVDEVQDYTPLQLHVLTKVFPRAKFTLVGDAFQSLNPAVKETAQASLGEVFASLGPQTVRLNKSYRSTQEIFHFCNGILGQKSAAETVLRQGSKPLVLRAEQSESLQCLAAQIGQIRKKGWETIAVICPTSALCQALYSRFKQVYPRSSAVSLDDEREHFQSGLLFLPVLLAKGLEFDAVILPQVNAEVYGQKHQRRLLYVAASRALHELSLIYSGELSPFIREIPAELFRQTSWH